MVKVYGGVPPEGVSEVRYETPAIAGGSAPGGGVDPL